jgi:asparagine synthase (glutamine-hydrolysing)
MLLSQLCKAALGRRAASYVRGRFTEGTLAALEPGFRRDYSEHLADQRSVFAAVNMDRHLRAQLEHYGFNQILHYEDHSAMAHSIEIRSPFIDYRLMEFAFRLPDAMKLNMGVTKWVLRESFAKRLPERIVWNHKKIGFNTPFGEWMGAPEMREFLGGLFGSDEFNDRSVWNAGVIRERFRAGDWSRFPIWRFINLELWARAYGIGNL